MMLDALPLSSKRKIMRSTSGGFQRTRLTLLMA
jgi:hypothetical protein